MIEPIVDYDGVGSEHFMLYRRCRLRVTCPLCNRHVTAEWEHRTADPSVRISRCDRRRQARRGMHCGRRRARRVGVWVAPIRHYGYSDAQRDLGRIFARHRCGLVPCPDVGHTMLLPEQQGGARAWAAYVPPAPPPIPDRFDAHVVVDTMRLRTVLLYLPYGVRLQDGHLALLRDAAREHPAAGAFRIEALS